MKVAVHLTKNILATLGITAAALAIDAGIPKKKKKKNTVLEMQIVQALTNSNLLLKRVT